MVDDALGGVNTGGINVVQEDDGVGFGAVDDVAADVGGVSVLPVPGVNGPKDNLLTEGGGGIADGSIEVAVGGTEEFDELAGGRLDDVGSAG